MLQPRINEANGNCWCCVPDEKGNKGFAPKTNVDLLLEDTKVGCAFSNLGEEVKRLLSFMKRGVRTEQHRTEDSKIMQLMLKDQGVKVKDRNK